MSLVSVTFKMLHNNVTNFSNEHDELKKEVKCAERSIAILVSNESEAKMCW